MTVAAAVAVGTGFEIQSVVAVAAAVVAGLDTQKAVIAENVVGHPGWGIRYTEVAYSAAVAVAAVDLAGVDIQSFVIVVHLRTLSAENRARPWVAAAGQRDFGQTAALQDDPTARRLEKRLSQRTWRQTMVEYQGIPKYI